MTKKLLLLSILFTSASFAQEYHRNIIAVSVATDSLNFGGEIPYGPVRDSIASLQALLDAAPSSPWEDAGSFTQQVEPTDTVLANFMRVVDSLKLNGVLSINGDVSLYRLAAGEMVVADALNVGSTTTARVRFSSSSTIAFVGASGSNSDIAVWALPKGVGDFNVTYNSGADFGLSVNGTTGTATTKALKLSTGGAIMDSSFVVSDSVFIRIGGVLYGMKARQ